MEEDKDLNDLILEVRKICHDFNQPLTVILARAELLLLKTPPDDPNRQALEQIHGQAEKLAELIDRARALFDEAQGE